MIRQTMPPAHGVSMDEWTFGCSLGSPNFKWFVNEGVYLFEPIETQHYRIVFSKRSPWILVVEITITATGESLTAFVSPQEGIVEGPIFCVVAWNRGDICIDLNGVECYRRTQGKA